VNTVFQNYALFPHLSVRENVAYGLRVRKTSATEIGHRVEEALRMVKMQEFADSQPSKLSGGQQQRVALAARSSIARCFSCSTSRFPRSTPICASKCKAN